MIRVAYQSSLSLGRQAVMPIYEYTCKQCGNFEFMQRITEAPLKKCPTCGSRVSKLISRSAFHLKGSGWYATDYGKLGASPSKTDDAKSTTSETKSSETKSSETKSSETKSSETKENSSSGTSSASSSAPTSTTKESSATS
jgi:putative FmdB family regulatory protein